MKRTLVFGDIHGGLKALNQVLNRAKVSENDTLIFLGDYVDGWSESSSVISRLIELEKSNNCVFIKGNHDQWCEDWLRSSNGNSTWLFHGGESTVNSYKGYNNEELRTHLNFFELMRNYYVDNKNRLFIHAGFASMHGVEKEPYPSNYSWDRTLWEMAYSLKDLELDESSLHYPKRFKHYSEIYIGHTPTTDYNVATPIIAQKLVNVDTGAAFKGKLTALDVDSKVFWQSDPLPELYPNEKGRN
ncbi:MAG: serine/threonine protein phosphatase [Crocinitomicaceae bacterium]|nr:serine/threonine protein phosphatase [Crocinitomicaceae bacterium]